MKLKKNLTIKDFSETRYISWGVLEEVFGKSRYKKFMKWMFGQTCHLEGAYPWDVKLYLEQINSGIKKPFVYD